jgi:hypothetical protein
MIEFNDKNREKKIQTAEKGANFVQHEGKIFKGTQLQAAGNSKLIAIFLL